VGESHAMERAFHVYVLAGKSGVLYTGVTGHLAKRIWQHKEKLVSGFVRRYNLDRLVWFERHTTARAAIAREKEIKGWRRSKKVALVEATNPQWQDLIERL
jgi:putative endonuclease